MLIISMQIRPCIEKLTDVSTSIKQMLQFTKKNSRQEQIDEIIFDKLKEECGE